MENFSVKLSRSKKEPGVLKINLKNQFTIYEAEKIKKDIDGKLLESNALKIEFNKLESIDVAGYQLIKSLMTYFKKDSKNVELSGDLSENTNKLLSNCGINLL